MSTNPVAERPAEAGLFHRLVDDAALFPPAETPLRSAVSAHVTLRTTSPYAGIVGPLLVPAAAAAEVAGSAAAEVAGGAPAGTARALEVALVARPGTSTATLREGVLRLADSEAVRVGGIELGWSADWRGLRELGVPVTVEIPREGREAAVADVAAAAGETGDTDRPAVQAKLRTGRTGTWPWPDERELAEFIRLAIDHDLGFKLTGGLHHAVRGEHPVGDGTEPQHGLLNVLAAVRHGLNGAHAAELGSLLAERDPLVLLDITTRMSAADVSIVRAFFTAYGCCSVLQPIGELAALGLLGGE